MKTHTILFFIIICAVVLSCQNQKLHIKTHEKSVIELAITDYFSYADIDIAENKKIVFCKCYDYLNIFLKIDHLIRSNKFDTKTNLIIKALIEAYILSAESSNECLSMEASFNIEASNIINDCEFFDQNIDPFDLTSYWDTIYKKIPYAACFIKISKPIFYKKKYALFSFTIIENELSAVSLYYILYRKSNMWNVLYFDVVHVS
jgi:hypothetical protein